MLPVGLDSVNIVALSIVVIGTLTLVVAGYFLFNLRSSKRDRPLSSSTSDSDTATTSVSMSTLVSTLTSLSNSPSPSNQSSPSASSPSPEFSSTSQKDPNSTKTLNESLDPSHQNLFGRLKSLFLRESNLEELESQFEEILYTSDLGPKVVTELMESFRDELSSTQRKNQTEVFNFLKSRIRTWILEAHPPKEFSSAVKSSAEMPSLKNSHEKTFTEKSQSSSEKASPDSKPAVWMIVGVNGVGKTTSIGKLAALSAKEGKRVLVAAGDTFRAAASEQLQQWSKRAQVEFFTSTSTQDPAAVAYQALEYASRKHPTHPTHSIQNSENNGTTSQSTKPFDLIIVDTAGRLHTQGHLMEELKKIKRSLGKLDATAPHEILLVLDANSGQNALHQAKDFHQVIGLTGVILTKMDGTARGGVVVGLYRDVGVPVKYIGIGEAVDDLKVFSPQEYVDALLK